MRWDIFLRFVHILHCRRKEEAINDEVEKKQTKSNSLTRNFKVYKAELYFGMIQLWSESCTNNNIQFNKSVWY